MLLPVNITMRKQTSKYNHPYGQHNTSKNDKNVLTEKVAVKFHGFRFNGSVRSFLVITGSGILIAGIGYAGYRWLKTIYDNIGLKHVTKSEVIKILARRLPLKGDSNGRSEEDSQLSAEDSSNEAEVRNWLENFDVKFPQYIINLPPVIDEYVANTPIGYEVPVIITLTVGLAGCFSNVRAMYLDNKFHRPNIMGIIEAPFSSLKGQIKATYDNLFGKRIRRDLDKMSDESGKKKIIQTLPPTVTEAALLDVIGNNQGIHAIVMDPETSTLVNSLKKGGLSYEILRKAYDNDEISRLNRTKNAPQGSFPTAINLLLTGTPNATSEFLKDEIEGGTASRMCLCVLPKFEKEIPKFRFPEGEVLDEFHNQLDEWTEKFAYTTDDDGNDHPVPPYETDMNYVSTALDEWIKGQYDLSVHEGNPARRNLRMRIATSVFHCAIVWHMLYGEPSSRQKDKRESVRNLTIYMANYFMERWLHKFGKLHNVQQAKFTAEELVKVNRCPNPTGNSSLHPVLPKDSQAKWELIARLRESGQSVAQIAKEYKLTTDAVNGYLRRYNEASQKKAAHNSTKASESN